MHFRTEEQQLAEFRDLMDSKLSLASAHARGTLAFYNLRAQADGISENSGIHWILRAQVGTLDKFATLLAADRAPSSIELLASARNLFENLVWLKLFLLDPSWGVFFYGQLLKNQREDLQRMINKLNAEAALFLSLDEEDSAIIDKVFHDLGEVDEPSPKYMTERTAELNRHKDELDRRARRAFALYAAAAAFNGYSYQAHLLNTKQIPHWQQQLDLVCSKIDDLRLELADQAKFDRYLGNWNWRGEADRVGMVDQYDFLYRLTSRLLHATPMNIVTEKGLLEGERLTLLEYIIISSQDVFDTIEGFDFLGKIDAVLVNIHGDPPIAQI